VEVLTRRQRNEIFAALDSKDVDPDDCELTQPHRPGPDNSTIFAEVRHVPTNSVFELSRIGETDFYWWTVHDGPHSPGKNRYENWAEMLNQLEHWAEEVQYVADVPDFWVELRQVPEILAAAQAPDASNAPFTLDEWGELSTHLDQAKDAVRRENPELTADQMSAIEQALDEIKEAGKRVGRKDWVMLANGALLGLVVNDLVPPHVVQSAFNMLITGIGHLFGFGGTPPIIST